MYTLGGVKVVNAMIVLVPSNINSTLVSLKTILIRLNSPYRVLFSATFQLLFKLCVLGLSGVYYTVI